MTELAEREALRHSFPLAGERLAWGMSGTEDTDA